MAKLDILRIRNAVFYAYHGVLNDEQNLGGKFEVDVDLFCNIQEGEASDNLVHTVDYEKVYQKMKALVLDHKFTLIESLGSRIANGIISEFVRVEKVTVFVRKRNPPVKGVVDYVEAVITREREP